MPGGFVYIMANKRDGTLYIGMTSDLPKRMQEHREGRGSQFAKTYGVTRLVYFEEYPLYADAIRRETNLKRWKRQWKIELIEKHNADWSDLAGDCARCEMDGRVKPGHGEFRKSEPASPKASGWRW